jgi:hypothetical protein
LIIAAFWTMVARNPDIVFEVSEPAAEVYYRSSEFLRDGVMTVPNRRGVSYEEFRNIAAYLSIGKRIDAIKYLRTVTGCGLKDAKDTVEGWTY